MRTRLRCRHLAVRTGVMLLALCLVAPPLTHTHGDQRVPLARIAGPPCSRGHDASHLHPAALERAQGCAACAAGPMAPATVGPSSAGEPVLNVTTVLQPATGSHDTAGRTPVHTRAPPALLEA